jgi:ribosomal protein S18 acetylase RimI-like enzyme
MADDPEPHLVIESDPDPEHARFLDDQLYAFNVQTTGITDDKLLAVSLRGPDGKVVGGAYGWTWGGTCYIRHLFVPASMRGQGLGTRIMRTVEEEAVARRCGQIVLETHDFQAPGFYRKLGFAIAGAVEGYPRGHWYLTMLKRLG